MAILENDKIKIEVEKKGAQIISLYNKETSIEHMWDGNEKYWSGISPILFPIIGNTWSKEYFIDDTVYKMNNHGLVRYTEFNLESISDDCLIYSFESNEETLLRYPFKFKLTVEYRLKGSKVNVLYKIENKSERDMPFSFGLHPAFNCPFEKEKKFEDYRLEFSNNETLKGLCGPFNLANEKVIELNYPIFEENETLCFENASSSTVQLTDGVHGVKVDVVGYRWLAFWTPTPNKYAKFICIEPWHGHGDFSESNKSFSEREGTINLSPNKSFISSLGIEIY
ncbi:MAG: aldose 1-epimerase family protein [Anaerorhabdus sp.]